MELPFHLFFLFLIIARKKRLPFIVFHRAYRIIFSTCPSFFHQQLSPLISLHTAGFAFLRNGRESACALQVPMHGGQSTTSDVIRHMLSTFLFLETKSFAGLKLSCLTSESQESIFASPRARNTSTHHHAMLGF